MDLASSFDHAWTTVAVPAYPSVTGLRHAISGGSLAGFFGALAWVWLLLVCFAGWGRAVARLFSAERLPASIACSLGITALVLFGGILNLVGAIDSWIIFLLVAVGLLLYILLRKQRPERYGWSNTWSQAPRAAQLLLIATLVILALRVAATVRLSGFDVTDDGSSYLVFPKIMLAVHRLAPGPFSDRHIISSVGGGYWLQAIVIAATSLANIGMADRTLGLLLLFVAVWDVGIAFGVPVEQIAIVEFLAYAVPQPTSNLTFVILPITLMLALLWFIFQSHSKESASPWRYAILAGAIGGATIALKSTFLPCVGAFCLVPFLLMNWSRKRRAFGLPLIAGAGAIVVLAAWMIAMNHTAGTFLFPVLGQGLDHTNLGAFGSFKIAKTPRTIVKLFLQGAVLLALGFAGYRAIRRTRSALFCLSVTFAAAVGITAFNLAAGGDSIWRYGFPQFFSAILIFSIGSVAFVRQTNSLGGKYLAWGLAILPLIGCVFYSDVAGARPQPFREMTWEVGHYSPGLQASLSGRSLASLMLRSEYRAIQDALPGNNIALENVAYPFLLSYKSRKIYLMDWPGAAGPAPGWPFGKSASLVAQYLRRNSVQYVIYDAPYARWADARSCQVLANPQGYSSELYVLFWMSLLAHSQLDAVEGRYRAIYNDGKIVVIDLSQPVENGSANQPIWKSGTDKKEMCAPAMTRYASHSVAGVAE